ATSSAGGMSGCQRLWPVFASWARGLPRSIWMLFMVAPRRDRGRSGRPARSSHAILASPRSCHPSENRLRSADRGKRRATSARPSSSRRPVDRSSHGGGLARKEGPMAHVSATWLIALLVALAAFPGSAVAAPQGQIVVALDSDRESLDPHHAIATLDYMVLMHVFDHLVARNPETMKLVGGLAESWKTVDDYTWEFRIRQGVKFQNGEPLDANAVKFNIDRVLDPAQKSPLRDRFSGITQVQVTDPFGIRVKTEKPNPVLLERLTNLAMLPPKLV